MPAANNGIFPRNGVPLVDAAPGASLLPTAGATCTVKFYAPRCNPRIDVQSLNTIISEIVNAVGEFDCERTDNLRRVLDNKRQTRVTRPSTGNQNNRQTLTADHAGTWPNVTWREAWMQRNGDIVTLHAYNPVADKWETVSIEAPENLVVLNNPVIYLRKSTGTSNPPIETQADLTVANAFDTMSSIRNFIRRTLIVGNVTIDGRGDYAADTAAAGLGSMNSDAFKGAAQVTVRGDPNNPDAFTIPYGGNVESRRVGASIGNGTLVLRDLTFRVLDEALNTQDFAAALYAVGDGTAQIAGRVKLNGFYNRNRPGANGSSSPLRAANGGTIAISSASTVVYDFDPGTTFRNIFLAGATSSLEIGGSVEWIISRGATIEHSILGMDANTFLRLPTGAANPNPLLVSGPAKFVTPVSAKLEPLSVVSSTNAYGSRADLVAYDFGGRVGSASGAVATMDVNALAIVNNVAGP